MSPNDANGMASSVDPDQTAHDQTQLNPVWYSYIMNDFLASKRSPFQNLSLFQNLFIS